ncbi:stress response protein NST1-like isoform X2 [Nasonia vitripennis]|uniref:Uncharacterized protein n=1 Tax=Nasonia vitripennis TaxID=7425 RepID=A0A7M7HGL2_NASVI|nr:stress response protein NST1-like isoform X2 [Nasonia vitripennis]
MPARLRCCCYSIAIAWMTIIATSHALVPSEDLRSFVVEKNRRTIGSLFVADASSASGENSEAKKKSLLRMTSPEIFQDSDSLFDSDSNAPHVRVKRIANSIDTLARSSEKSTFSYRDRRRNPQKIFKRFAIQETNPADENEAEYSNFDEGNVDFPGNAFLGDEISRKRNHLEDVYPEVTDLPKTEESRAKRSNVANRRKRDRQHRDEENEEEYDDVDCVDDEDFYYDDEIEDRQTDSRSKNYEEEEEEKEQKMKKRTSASSASESKSNSDRLSESGRNSKVVDDEEQLAALKGKSSADSSTSSKKSYKDTQTKEKTKPKKKPTEIKSKDDQKKRANGRKGKTKSESKQSKNKAKPKPTDKKKDKKRAKPTSKSKSSQKVEKSTAPAVHRVTTESIANVNSNEDGNDKCAEEEEDNAGEDRGDKERLKRNKSILVKAVPQEGSVKELQIFQRADNSKKKTDKSDKKTTVAPNKVQSEATLGKSDKYIGEVKDLLGRLIVKIDDLHNLVSEMRSTKVNRQELVDEKITRSNFPVDRRRPRPCSFRRSSSSSSVLWSPWTRWSSCSVSCGRGSQTRDRRCLGGCDHQLNIESQTRVCHLSECPPAKFLGIF